MQLILQIQVRQERFISVAAGENTAWRNFISLSMQTLTANRSTRAYILLQQIKIALRGGLVYRSSISIVGTFVTADVAYFPSNSGSAAVQPWLGSAWLIPLVMLLSPWLVFCTRWVLLPHISSGDLSAGCMFWRVTEFINHASIFGLWDDTVIFLLNNYYFIFFPNFLYWNSDMDDCDSSCIFNLSWCLLPYTKQLRMELCELLLSSNLLSSIYIKKWIRAILEWNHLEIPNAEQKQCDRIWCI